MTTERCPGCTTMHAIQPCFPGCGGEQTTSPQPSTVAKPSTNGQGSVHSGHRALKFGLAARYVVRDAGETTRDPRSMARRRNGLPARAPRRSGGDHEPLPSPSSYPREGAA